VKARKYTSKKAENMYGQAMNLGIGLRHKVVRSSNSENVRYWHICKKFGLLLLQIWIGIIQVVDEAQRNQDHVNGNRKAQPSSVYPATPPPQVRFQGKNEVAEISAVR